MKLMSNAIKITIFLWLIFCAWSTWLALNILAYVLLMSNNMSNFAWIAGLMSTTSASIIGWIAVKSLKINIIDAIRQKLTSNTSNTL